MIAVSKYTGRLGNQMFQLAYLHAQACEGVIPDIYLQNEKYFKKYEGEIRALYSVGVKPIDQVSIHVRRTDYVGNNFYTQLWATDYYRRAIDMFPNESFLVFSDDIEWCKRHFTGKQFEFSKGNDEITDLNLMAGCKHNIIANSSFSWWAAYLNPNPHKKVVAPKEWYTDGNQTRTVCPDNWIRI